MQSFEKVFLITISIPFFVVLLFFFSAALYGPESYYRFEPYSDTEMSVGYSPEKFEPIEIGMDTLTVKKILGEPLYKNYDSARLEASIKYEYTNDGKLLKQEVAWYMSNDYAWRRGGLVFNDLGIVTQKKGEWIHD